MVDVVLVITEVVLVVFVVAMVFIALKVTVWNSCCGYGGDWSCGCHGGDHGGGVRGAGYLQMVW